MIHRNPVSKTVYQGKNQAELAAAAAHYGFVSTEWVTFLQAREIGLKIKKGAKSTGVFKGFGNIDEIDDKGKVRTRNAPLGFARVFNLEQTQAREDK